MSATTRYINAIDRCIRSLKAGGHWDKLGTALLFVGGQFENCFVPIKRGMPLPENFNFVVGDHRLAEGMIGDGATKYVDLKYNNNADPQNDQSMGCWVSWLTTTGTYMGVGGTADGATNIARRGTPDTDIIFRSRNGSSNVLTGQGNMPGYVGMTRNAADKFWAFGPTSEIEFTQDSQVPLAGDIWAFSRNLAHSPINGRLAIVFAGRSDDLAALRVIFTALIDDIKTIYYNLPTGNLVASFDFSDGVQGWGGIGSTSVEQDNGRLIVSSDEGNGGPFRNIAGFTDWGVGARIRIATKARTLDGDSYTINLRNSSAVNNWTDRSGNVLSLTPTLTDFVTEFTIASITGALWYSRSSAQHYTIHNIDIRRIG